MRVCVCVSDTCVRSDAQDPEEEEDGEEEEERVLPVVAVVCVFVGLLICSVMSVCSVERVVGVKDCGEKTKRKSTDPERHVKACVSKTLKRSSALRL